MVKSLQNPEKKRTEGGLWVLAFSFLSFLFFFFKTSVFIRQAVLDLYTKVKLKI